jgi:dolichol-phosphate mannosyltransferase
MAKKKTALLIIPTYNEAKNIGGLLQTVFSLDALEPMGWQLDVLIMDDTSPDGTGEVVQKLAATKYKGRLFLHTGKKEGLGRALQKAFDAALSYKHQVILTMDGDFSHDPHDIPGLLAAIDKGADVAIGSRYIEGGLIPGNWPLGLIIRTRIATAVAHWLGGVSNDINELTTNFRAMRRHVLETIGYNSVRANGYGIQIFLANAFTRNNFKVAEVPITFRSRAHGNCAN